MNSLNLLSARVIGQTPLAEKIGRTRSKSESARRKSSLPARPQRSVSHFYVGGGHADYEEKDMEGAEEVKSEEEEQDQYQDQDQDQEQGQDQDERRVEALDEKQDDANEQTALLAGNGFDNPSPDLKPRQRRLHILVKRIADALTESLQWILEKLAAPALYLAAYFYDEQGHASPMVPVRKMWHPNTKKSGSKSTAHAIGLSGSSVAKSPEKRSARSSGRSSSKSPATSDSEAESGSKAARGKASRREDSPSTDDNAPARRSIRIKHNEETARRKKAAKVLVEAAKASNTPEQTLAAELKSPTSPASSLRITKYPHAPTPPRPLIPRRQPSYSAPAPVQNPPRIHNTHQQQQQQQQQQKTLVIDLDETLIHSMAKGGRMSSGHMVEVKLQTTSYNGHTIGPQHPILYYVHKRPHCDDFLRKICKWYNLVVFTASVQEYADPVIDWLEQERKFFSARYYRQHCTFRNGAYIKDLSSVEPDLSKVMILDNSPLSYIFHEDNAIPIEGWINDPTDNDLLHLVPLLEALQYVTDVRALLALRRGEVEAAPPAH